MELYCEYTHEMLQTYVFCSKLNKIVQEAMQTAFEIVKFYTGAKCKEQPLNNNPRLF